MKFPAWSYSALNSWETCPRRHAEIKLLKRVPDVKGEAALWGTTVHTAFENRLKHKTPLPDWGASWEPICQRLEKSPGTMQIEQRVALTDKFEPCEFFSKWPVVWVRAVADVAIYGDRSIFTNDWKTGGFKPDTDQLRLSAAIQLAHKPVAERVTICYSWLKEGRTTVETIHRDQLPAIWAEFLPRVQRMQAGIEQERFDPKPSGLCRKHCPVMSCEFNGRR